jgi:hypothetical protein
VTRAVVGFRGTDVNDANRWTMTVFLRGENLPDSATSPIEISEVFHQAAADDDRAAHKRDRFRREMIQY